MAFPTTINTATTAGYLYGASVNRFNAYWQHCKNANIPCISTCSRTKEYATVTADLFTCHYDLTEQGVARILAIFLQAEGSSRLGSTASFSCDRISLSHIPKENVSKLCAELRTWFEEHLFDPEMCHSLRDESGKEERKIVWRDVYHDAKAIAGNAN